MLYGYLFAAIVGIVMLVASLLGGGDHDAGHAGAIDHDASTVTPESIALRVFSVRVWTYFLAFGGLAGTLLRLLAKLHEPHAFFAALGVGAFCAWAAQTLITRAAQGDRSGTVTSRDLVGRSAGVIVPFEKGQTGKVRVQVEGRDIDLLAVTDDGEPLRERDEVLVVEVREDTSALVTKSPSRESK